jgi:hypothetical protein
MAETEMDEMAAVRQLRADAPLPDHARLTPARQRLLDEIAAPRRRHAGWKLKALGAAAAVVTAALFSTVALRQDHRPPTEPAPATPRPTQWVYQHVDLSLMKCHTGLTTSAYSEVGSIDLGPGNGTYPCTMKPGKQVAHDEWVRYDGLAYARPNPRKDDPDHLSIQGDHRWFPSNDMLTPRATDALVAALPDDPEAALELIRKRSFPSRLDSSQHLTQAQRDLDEVLEVLSGATTVPADKARILYRVITELDGATKPAEITDGAGRTVLAIGVDGDFRDRVWARNGTQVLLDPDTYAYRGVRWVAGLDYYVGGKASGGPFVKKGTQIGMATRISTTVVDKAGDRK